MSTMPEPMQNGPVNDYQQRQNGNWPHGAAWWILCMYGGMKPDLMVNGWRIVFREIFLRLTQPKTGSMVHLRLVHFPPTDSDCMIWLEMYGKYAVIFTIPLITLSLLIIPKPTHPVPPFQLLRLNLNSFDEQELARCPWKKTTDL